MLTILIRTILIYIILTGVMRLMGKRQIGELQLSELIIALLLSEIATSPITDTQIPIANALIPIATLISLEIIITFIATKSAFCKKLFDGTPSLLIRRGELQQKELAKLRMSLEELMGELRQKGIADIADVEYAVIEQNGKLSVFTKAELQPVRAADLKISCTESGISHPLVTDGHISDYNLNLIGHDKEWLLHQLLSHGLKPDRVFLYAIDDAGQETLIEKE